MTWHWRALNDGGEYYWVPDVPGAWNLLPPVPPPPSVPDSWRAAYSPSAVYPPVPEIWEPAQRPLPDGWLAVPSYPPAHAWPPRPPAPDELILLEQIAKQWGLVPQHAGIRVQVFCAAVQQPPAPEPAREQSPAGYFLPPRWLLHMAGLIIVAGLTAILILLALRLS